MSKLIITETEKQKCSAIYEGYQYRKHRTNKENVISWLCLKEKKEKCRGTLKSKNGVVISISDHSCKPDPAKIDVNLQICNAKKRARMEDKGLSDIYREEMQPLYTKGYDFVTDIPEFRSIKTSLYDARRKARGEENDPKTAQEIIISEEMRRMEDGTDFLLEDKNDEDRIIVFASENGKELLKNYKTFFVDGTFKSSSKQFKQLYTVHVDIGSSSKEINIITAAYALLNKKDTHTYENLFLTLQEKANWDPECVIMDFEKASIVALQNIFPNIQIRGCNFHFNQSLWRKIQELGLVNEYKNDSNVQLHLRMCAALAHLPANDIDDGWFAIMLETPINEKLQSFYEYFSKEWLNNTVISKNMWNCHRELHRTNNAVEGWHHKLNSCISKPHPKFKTLVEILKKDAENNLFLKKRHDLNLEKKGRLPQYIKLDIRINRILNDYEASPVNDPNRVLKCLKALAYVSKFH